MRKLLGFFVCALLATTACTEQIIIKQGPAPDAPTVDDEEPAPTPSPTPPTPSDPLVVDLGAVQAGVDVPFEVPAGALGFNIVMEGEVADFDQDRPYGIERIVDPNGKTVHASFMPVGGTKSTSTAAFDTIAAASVPQSEAVAETIPAGKWTVRFGVENNPSAKPTVYAKVRIQSSGDGAFYGGKLDLHVHVPTGLRVGGATVNPAEAASDSRIKERLDLFFQLTTQLLGIERGEVTFHTAAARFAELDDQEILQGFAVSRGAEDGTQALHVLFTNEISQGGQPIAAGISPGIPGAATVFGRGVSGIIVATYSSRDEDVLTMFHEAGHFFGLNHTTEFDGQSADPLADTPRCNGISGGNLGSCPDRTNIMFPAGAIDGPVTLSPTQKRVYRGSPIYKAFPAGTKQTQSWSPFAPQAIDLSTIRRRFRASGRPLSRVESELSLGYCGLTPIDAGGMVARLGEATAVAQLSAAANDLDLSPIIRGRAKVALAKLGH
ncbi:MAG: hypothetical protein KF819_23650 [Labilithrix sp.]|nr:hypothetical protein [Labilithrix sp.]